MDDLMHCADRILTDKERCEIEEKLRYLIYNMMDCNSPRPSLMKGMSQTEWELWAEVHSKLCALAFHYEGMGFDVFKH